MHSFFESDLSSNDFMSDHTSDHETRKCESNPWENERLSSTSTVVRSRKRALITPEIAIEIFSLKYSLFNLTSIKDKKRSTTGLGDSVEVSSIYGISPKAVRDIWNGYFHFMNYACIGLDLHIYAGEPGGTLQAICPKSCRPISFPLHHRYLSLLTLGSMCSRSHAIIISSPA
jgi:hypothetical protein